MAELDRIVRQRGKPRSIMVDNGPEFAGRLLDQWAWLNRIELDLSRPGKPTERAGVRHRSKGHEERLIEAFNSRLCQECLNASWFLSMADARDRIDAWKIDDNEPQPHSAPGSVTSSASAADANGR